MLSKAVCKVCIGRHETEGWQDFDERRWRGEVRGWPPKPHVLCPVDFGGATEVLSDIPSDECPYAAEHLVSQDAE